MKRTVLLISTWQLLPGNYVERYRISLGRIFESEGALAEFTPTMGDKKRIVGGFIVMNDQPGAVKLYHRSEGGSASANYGFVGVAIAQAMSPAEGDLVLVADFDSLTSPAIALGLCRFGDTKRRRQKVLSAARD